jgi:XRE family transcriptional regulator, regulator of sulfur utilization
MTDPLSDGSAAPPAGSIDALARFGDNLRRIRQARRYSQEVVAKRARIHRTQMTLLENGERSPGIETLVKLAGALEVSIDMLVEGIVFVQVPGGTELRASPPPELPRVSMMEGKAEVEAPNRGAERDDS